MTGNEPKFTFGISLSVLNHLGRNLYRSFATVLGEAISNAWDADATNVWIYIDQKNNNLVIKDDGTGMSADDFQHKFLRIGYSKRKEGEMVSAKSRPFIGRKGIGKLALLSCAQRITVITKQEGGEYVGGVIDNSGLDQAITNDLLPQDYPLEGLDYAALADFTKDHKKGTIIRFENIHEGIKSNLAILKKVVALYFRFSLIDDSFNIIIDGEKIDYHHLADLGASTQFLWHTTDFVDPFLSKGLVNLKEAKTVSFGEGVTGFVASVETPRNLSINSTGERVSIDLFVNGRLREKDIVKHLSIAKVAENYLYGQIHFNGLDELDVDRFTTSREGVIADDKKYQDFLDGFKKTLESIIREWDVLRRKYRMDGNSEDESLSKKERKSGELYNAVAGDYAPPRGAATGGTVDGWIDELADDARFNLTSYAECFISENLVRKYMHQENVTLSEGATNEIAEWKAREVTRKQEGNINIELRQRQDDLSYLDMTFLAKEADRPTGAGTNNLTTDGKEFRPIRNAVMHTALITEEAKRKLTSVYENIKGRIRSLLYPV